MKSLNKITYVTTLDNNFFTEEVLSHIYSEGFEFTDNNSYAESRNLKSNKCYKKYERSDSIDIYIYICEDGIEIDRDYECGGNLSTHFIKFSGSFEEAYDEMVDYVNRNR